MPGVEEIPRGASSTSYYSSLNAIPGKSYKSSFVNTADGKSSSGEAGGSSNGSAAASKRKRINYSQAALEAQAYASNVQNAEEENLSEAQILEIKRQRLETQQRERLGLSGFLSPAEERAASKRFDELDRENYNDAKCEIPRNLYVKSVRTDKRRGAAQGDDDDEDEDDNDDEDDDGNIQSKGKDVVVPVSAAVKRLMLSRKTITNYYDEIDQSQWSKLKLFEAIPDFQTQKKLCTVCGNLSPSSCMKCDSRVCSVKCLRTHQETRCNR